MKKMVLIAPSDLPIPSVKGGAIETGIQQIIDENEKEHKVDITVYSYFNEEAYELSKKYRYAKFIYYKSNVLKEFSKFFIKGMNYILKKVKIKKRFNVHHLYLRFIIKKMKVIRSDVVLIKNAISYVIPINKKINTKIYLQLHNDFFNNSTYNAEKIVSSCDGLIANSEYIKKCILTIKNANQKKVMVNKNCLDYSDFDEITVEDLEKKAIQYKIDTTKKNIIFSGRLVQQKGIRELIYAVQNISKEIDWNLLIVGSKWFGRNIHDKYTKELEEISKNNIDRIKFVGFVKHSDIKFLNKIADVAVVPSMWEEPAGRVALEAQVVGTPLIISDSGGLSEYVNEQSAIIVARGENFILNLTKALDKVLLDDVLRKKMGEAGKEFTLSYNSNNYYNEILTELDII